MQLLFKLLGILGLLLITRSIFIKKESVRDWYLVFGGIALLLYSAYLRDLIFIVLQIVFTASSLYRIYSIQKSRSKLPIDVSTDEVIRLESNDTTL